MTADREHQSTDACGCGVCGTDVPPLVGSVLTGTGLTLDGAADLLVAGRSMPPMTAVQLRLVDQHAEARPAPAP